MPTNSTRGEMIRRGPAKGGDADVRLITRTVQSAFALYAADGSHLGTIRAESAQAAFDQWIAQHDERPLLVDEQD